MSFYPPLLAIITGLTYDRLTDKAFISDLSLEGAVKTPGYDNYQYLKADNTTIKVFKAAPGLYGAATIFSALQIQVSFNAFFVHVSRFQIYSI